MAQRGYMKKIILTLFLSNIFITTHAPSADNNIIALNEVGVLQQDIIKLTDLINEIMLKINKNKVSAQFILKNLDEVKNRLANKGMMLQTLQQPILEMQQILSRLNENKLKLNQAIYISQQPSQPQSPSLFSGLLGQASSLLTAIPLFGGFLSNAVNKGMSLWGNSNNNPNMNAVANADMMVKQDDSLLMERITQLENVANTLSIDLIEISKNLAIAEANADDQPKEVKSLIKDALTNFNSSTPVSYYNKDEQKNIYKDLNELRQVISKLLSDLRNNHMELTNTTFKAEQQMQQIKQMEENRRNQALSSMAQDTFSKLKQTASNYMYR